MEMKTKGFGFMEEGSAWGNLMRPQLGLVAIVLVNLLFAGCASSGDADAQGVPAVDSGSGTGLSGSGGSSACTLDGSCPEEDSDSVSILLSEVSTTMKQYAYTTSGGIEVRYIVVEGSDGQPRTAFDACEVCGGSKGYEQKGTDVMCRNCGRYFEIDGLGTQNTGRGCWPAYLPHTVSGDSLILKKEDLENGIPLFA